MFTTLISTDELSAHLDAPSWRVVDTRYDLSNDTVGYEQYLTGHVASAVYASLSHDLSGERTGINGRHPLPTPEAMSQTFGRLGIEPGTQVVCYDADSGMFAARLWWMLRYMGHDAVAVLDGGFAKWTREGRLTRAGIESASPGHFVGKPRAAMRVSLDDMVGRTAASMHLVDARSPERFEGRNETLDKAAGHIPGAMNRFFKDNVGPEGTLLPRSQLRDAFADLLGATPPEQVTMYCGSGVTACHNVLAMEHAGLPGARLYVGSWSEWSASPDRPIETGPAKR